MKFEEALSELRKGKKIRHAAWDPSFYLSISEDCLNYFPCTPHLISAYWEVFEEPGKTFPEVFEAFKEGKKVKRKSWDRILCIENLNLTLVDCHDLLATDWMICE
jgi:hypothetical protein